MSDRLRREIDQIPGADGFWKSRAQMEYQTAADTLAQAGIKEDKILELLTGLYWTAAEEYGA